MTYKCISLLKRKDGLGREEFIARYEDHHAPLIRRLLPQIREYRRNFVDWDTTVLFGGETDFDAVTELWFDDRAGFDAFMARCAEPEVAQAIADDEEHLFDRSKTRLFVVDERGGRVPEGSQREAGLRAIEDEREIHRRLGLYSRALDSRNFVALDDIFTADVTFNYGLGGDQHGIDALKAWMHRSLDNCGGTQHLIGNTLVDIDGDRASSQAYVQARHQAAGVLGGPLFDANGEYIDQWERRSEGWRIVHRVAHWSNLSGEPRIIGVERLQLD